MARRPAQKSTPWLRDIGARFKAIRERAGKDQDELGVSPTTIGKLESGGGITLTKLEVACSRLGISPVEIFVQPVTSPVTGNPVSSRGRGDISSRRMEDEAMTDYARRAANLVDGLPDQRHRKAAYEALFSFITSGEIGARAPGGQAKSGRRRRLQ